MQIESPRDQRCEPGESLALFEPTDGSAPKRDSASVSQRRLRSDTGAATVSLHRFMEIKREAQRKAAEIPRVLGIRFYEGRFADPQRVLVDIEFAIPGCPS